MIHHLYSQSAVRSCFHKGVREGGAALGQKDRVERFQLIPAAIAVQRTGSVQTAVCRTAHIVVTMGMPAIIYRLFYGAHSLKSLERNILKFVGIKPVRRSIIGNVEGDHDIRDYWLGEMTARGRAGR